MAQDLEVDEMARSGPEVAKEVLAGHCCLVPLDPIRDLCGDKIWGLSAKGSTCTDCGFSCHSKCEMKVPAKCPGVLDKAAEVAGGRDFKAGGFEGVGTAPAGKVTSGADNCVNLDVRGQEFTS